ncbi:hypothetical protein HWV62_40158 [Athelia sp. TMB]|nr:hypothetical protein HWV62_40158 [Athelia sp. TMB]
MSAHPPTSRSRFKKKAPATLTPPSTPLRTTRTAPLSRVISLTDSETDEPASPPSSRAPTPDSEADDPASSPHLRSAPSESQGASGGGLPTPRSSPAEPRPRLRRLHSESYSDPEFDSFVANVPLTENDEVVLPHPTTTRTASVPISSSSHVAGPSTSTRTAPAPTASSSRAAGPPTTPRSGPQHAAIYPRLPVTPTRTYEVTSPRRSGPVDDWEIAGNLTQGAPGARARRTDTLQAPPPISPSKLLPKSAYVVYEGLEVGIFYNWNDVSPVVERIMAATFEAFPSVLAARRAWDLACSVNVVRRLDSQNRIARVRLPAYSIDVSRRLRAVADDYLGVEWHVVSQGRRPGVYPCW